MKKKPIAGHIYKFGGQDKVRPKFESEYGKTKGDYVYGAVVGKLYRKRKSR